VKLLTRFLEPVAAHPAVCEVRQRGFMVGIELTEHPVELRMGHRVTLEARRRGAIIRPLGDVVVLMPPLAIGADDLERLVAIAAEAIDAATAPVALPRAA
jgi:adenosylmethionine-8-amino-7-oxononanoate aminotransferase